MLLISLAIFAIVIIIAVININYQNSHQLSNQEPQNLPSKARNIFDLQIGDIVQYGDTDWVVEGKLTYTVSAYYWFEYLLQDSDRLAWLAVEEDDKVEVSLLEPNNTLDIPKIDINQPPSEIKLADEIYKYKDSGIARMMRTGLTMHRTAETCEYFDYQAPDNRVLSVEVWDGEIEVSVGSKINPRSLILLPGDGKTVYRD